MASHLTVCFKRYLTCFYVALLAVASTSYSKEILLFNASEQVAQQQVQQPIQLNQQQALQNKGYHTHPLAKKKPISNTADHQPINALKAGFNQPAKQYYPETWFHLNGKNISKVGLTADLEAISYSGMQGIQLFNKSGPAFENVEQISILSPEWESMIAHVADESDRLGLALTFQNCPGWSMAGGPWMSAEQAQRELIEHEFQVSGGQLVEKYLPIAKAFTTDDRNYQDVQVIAFPTPSGHQHTDLTPISYASNNPRVPWQSIFDKTKRVQYQFHPRRLHDQAPFRRYQQEGIQPVEGKSTWVHLTFASPVTLRALELPPVRSIQMNMQYPKTDVELVVESKINGKWQQVSTLHVPSTHWYDLQYSATLAIPETTSSAFRITFKRDPLFLSYLKLHGRSYLHNHESKAAKSSRNLQHEVQQSVSANTVIDVNTIINLTDKLDASGKLTWQAPPGDWTVVRFGHVNMLRTNRPAEPEATGWEASKMDKEAIEYHLRQGMMGNLMRKGGPLDGHDLHGLLIDSWESYVPTWTMKTNRYFTEFEQRRGYDMRAYLPAMMGYVVNSIEQTNKFLRDIRQTNDDLYVENFFDHFRTVSHDMGANVYTEGASGETLPGEPLRYYGVSDYPMTEFWFPKAPSNQKEAKPIYAAASAYHLYDKPFLAAEAATQLSVKWDEHPQTLDYLINENFAKGVNHLVFHTFSHTPQMDVVPGSSFGGNIGFPLLRTQTWWQHTPTWMTQLARAQYLLRQGEFVADVLWYLGDDLDRHPFDTAPFPKGYKFDYLNEEILQQKVNMVNGHIAVKGAGNYRVIMLRDSQRMLLSTAKKLQQLVKNGAVILGRKPLDSPSLMDDAEDLVQLHTIASSLWGDSPSGMKQVGKGRVYWGQPLDNVLKQERIQPDVSVPKGANIHWLHRQDQALDLYFVTNQHAHAIDVNVSFRVAGGQVSFWDPNTGTVRPAPLVSTTQANRTNVVVSLPAFTSQFVVFDAHAKQAPPVYTALYHNKHPLLKAESGWVKHHTQNAAPSFQFTGTQVEGGQGQTPWFFSEPGDYQLKTASGQFKSIQTKSSQQAINGPWQVHFEAGWGAPSHIILATLQPLSDHTHAAVRHYSGTMRYQTGFEFDNMEFDNMDNAEQVLLDLGQVANIAQVRINGEVIATKLRAPFVFDIKPQLKQGHNQLEVHVTNTWRNQLIFDNNRSPEDKKTWTTNAPKPHEKQLTPAGLIGPVKLLVVKSQFH